MSTRSRHNPTLVALAIEEAFLCHYCGKQTPLPEGTRDHIVPKAFGAHGFLWNLVYSCGPCNHSRGHTFIKCHCSKCGSARLRWALEEDIQVTVRLMRRDGAMLKLAMKCRQDTLVAHGM